MMVWVILGPLTAGAVLMMAHVWVVAGRSNRTN